MTYRITKTVLAETLESVKYAAKFAGLKSIDYGGNYTVDDLEINSYYGLVARDPENGGIRRIINGTNREILNYLNGMLFALDSLKRFNA